MPQHGCSARRSANLRRWACASAGGDGFADGFPVEALAELMKAKLARPQLAKADWVAFAAVGRT